MTKATIITVIANLIIGILIGFIQKDVWKIKTWKYFIITPLLNLSGILGAKTASWIAYGRFSGTRLYGSVLAVGIALSIIAIMLCIPYKEMYGFGGVVMWKSVAVTKVGCIIDGCCAGRVLYVNSSGKEVLFPSQIVETVVAALFFIWFFNLAKTKYLHSALYPLFMTWYGIYRYLADWMRGHPLEQSPFVLWIPAGRFFSILIFIIGIISLYLVLNKEYGKKLTYKVFAKALIGK